MKYENNRLYCIGIISLYRHFLITPHDLYMTVIYVL